MAIIVSNIKELEKQFPPNKNLSEVIKYLRSLSNPEKRAQLESLQPGKNNEVEIVGRDVYAIEQTYLTKPRSERCYEAHRKYIDLQVMVSGEEIIEATSLDGLRLLPSGAFGLEWWKGEFHEGNDVAIYSNEKKGKSSHMKPGMIGVFFPEDAHMPLVQQKEDPEKVIKVVVKYSVRELLK